MKCKEIIKRILFNSPNKNVRRIGEVIRDIYDAIFNRSRLSELVKYRPYMNDKKYIERQYKKRFGRELDLENPRDFNEKNCWRKLYDRQDIYTRMVDKYLVKKIIEEKVGENHTFPLLGVWNNPKDINLNKLPDQFVLKANHAGGIIVCRNKKSFDLKAAIKELSSTLKIDYASHSREWPYKNVKRKIIAEKYMGENLTDYKVYCFNGKMEYTFVWENKSRIDGHKPTAYFCGAYDRTWNRSGIEIEYPSLNKVISKPDCFDEMKNIVEIMSKGIPFVRIDCYIINNCVYVGEMTFFPWSGYMKFKEEIWNKKLGDLEELSIVRS